MNMCPIPDFDAGKTASHRRAGDGLRAVRQCGLRLRLLDRCLSGNVTLIHQAKRKVGAKPTVSHQPDRILSKYSSKSLDISGTGR